MLKYLRLLTLLLLPLLAACAGTGCGLAEVAATPLTVARGQPTLEVTINGHPARMLLDTGAGHSVLTGASAQRLGLRIKPGVITTSEGIGGSSRAFGLAATPLTVGGASLGDHTFAVVPPLKGWPAAMVPDGMLGMDVLGAYDLDLDLAHARLTLYRGPACPDQKLPMPGPATVIETAVTNRGHLAMRAAIDGRPVLAILDTGAQATLVTARAAGIPAAQLEADPPVKLFGVGPGDASARLHRFDSVTIGGETIADPRLIVLDSAPADYDMIVGMNFLGDRRLWISAGTGRIFLRTAR